LSAVGVNAKGTGPWLSELVATSFAYPSEVIDNDEYFRRCRFELKDRSALIEQSRMRTRRWCSPTENTRTLAKAAIADLTRREPELCREIDAVVVASGTTVPFALPSDPENRAVADLAPFLIGDLGLSHALGLDIKACYCSGFLRGLQVVDGLLANPNYRAALLVAVEQGSRLAVAETNRTSFCFIVSDAAGAALFRRAQPKARAGILDYCGFTDATKFSWVGIGEDAASIVMLGSRAAEATLEMLTDAASTLLRRNGLTPESVDWLLPIQTHAGLLDQLSRALEWPTEKVLWRGDVNGFSGSASIPSCLAEELSLGRVKKGDLVLSVAVGAGMNSAGALYYA
jgi:3-oxoacyl-[acyl-carrier-protein] synthase-3